MSYFFPEDDDDDDEILIWDETDYRFIEVLKSTVDIICFKYQAYYFFYKYFNDNMCIFILSQM